MAYSENPQGTEFLPPSEGGDYYPKGWYIKKEGSFISDRNSINSALNYLGLQVSDNLVRVKVASDIFNKTINTNSIYFLDNPNIIQPNNQSILIGQGGLNLTGFSLRASKITSSEDGTPMFKVDPAGTYSGALNFSNFSIVGSGTNSVIYDLDNDGQTDNENNNIDWINVTYVNCSDLGTISNYRQGFWDVASSIFCGGLQLLGTWSGGFRSTSFRILHSDIEPFFKESPALTLGGRFFTDAFYTGFGSHGGFCGYSPSNINNDGDFQIIGGNFEVSGSPVNDISDFFPNMPISSTKAFYDSIGFEKTNVGGRIRWTATAPTVIPSAGTWVKLAGTTELINPQWTSATGNNQLNYISNQPSSGAVIASITISGGTSDDVGVRLRHFISSSSTTVTLDDAFVTIPLFGSSTLILIGYLELNNGDYIFTEGTNLSDTTSITAEVGSKYILSKR